MTFHTLDEAVAMQNGVPQGLSSALFTNNLRHGERFISASAATAASPTSISAPPARKSAERSEARRKPAAAGKPGRMHGKRICGGKPIRSTGGPICRWHKASSSAPSLGWRGWAYGYEPRTRWITGTDGDGVSRNRAAKILRGLLEEAGVGFYPVVDHVTCARSTSTGAPSSSFRSVMRTMKRCSMTTGTPRSIGRPAIPPCSWIRPMRTPAARPASFPAGSPPSATRSFTWPSGVEDIDRAVARLKSNGWNLRRRRRSRRRATAPDFSAPELVNGQPFTVLELAERHRGYQDFSRRKPTV